MGERNLQTLKQVIEEFSKLGNRKQKLSEVDIMHTWERLVDADVLRETEKIFIKHGVIYIKINKPSLKNNIRYQTSELISRVNEIIGEEVLFDIVLL